METICLEIRLGLGTTEAVSPRRRNFHQWVSSQLVHGSVELVDNSPSETLVLSEEAISGRPAEAYSLIVGELNHLINNQRDCIVVIDLSANPFELLRDSVLFHIGTALKAIVAGKGERTVGIVFSQLPSETSLFWSALKGISGLANFVLAVDISGNTKSSGVVSTDILHSVSRQIRAKFLGVTGDVIEVLRPKLLKRLGHFKRKVNGYEKCCRYFFDAGSCVPELMRLFDYRIDVAQKEGLITAPGALLVFGPMSPWIREVALTLGADLEIDVYDISLNGPRKKLPEGAIVLTDLVDSGASLGQKLEELGTWEGAVQSRVFSAMGRSERISICSSGVTYTVESLLVVSPEAVSTKACEQCALGIPFSGDPKLEPVDISSYNLWWMFSRIPWVEERDIPPERSSMGIMPDMKAVFDEFGSWIAYKIERYLRTIGMGEETVVVCPDETGSSAMVDCLRLRFDNRLIAIAIPRVAITKAHKLEINEIRNFLLRGDVGNDKQGWIRQLLMAAERRQGVVVMDEFTVSGSTLRGLTKILLALNVSISATFPVLDLMSEQDRGGSERGSLYSISLADNLGVLTS